jgi:hypothetical protein
MKREHSQTARTSENGCLFASLKLGRDAVIAASGSPRLTGDQSVRLYLFACRLQAGAGRIAPNERIHQGVAQLSGWLAGLIA